MGLSARSKPLKQQSRREVISAVIICALFGGFSATIACLLTFSEHSGSALSPDIFLGFLSVVCFYASYRTLAELRRRDTSPR